MKEKLIIGEYNGERPMIPEGCMY